jgi:hypothetical protein
LDVLSPSLSTRTGALAVGDPTWADPDESAVDCSGAVVPLGAPSALSPSLSTRTGVLASTDVTWAAPVEPPVVCGPPALAPVVALSPSLSTRTGASIPTAPT